MLFVAMFAVVDVVKLVVVVRFFGFVLIVSIEVLDVALVVVVVNIDDVITDRVGTIDGVKADSAFALFDVDTVTFDAFADTFEL